MEQFCLDLGNNDAEQKLFDHYINSNDYNNENMKVRDNVTKCRSIFFLLQTGASVKAQFKHLGPPPNW